MSISSDVESRIKKQRRFYDRMRWVAIAAMISCIVVALIPNNVDDRKRFCLEHGYPEIKIVTSGKFSFGQEYYCANSQVAVKIESLGYQK